MRRNTDVDWQAVHWVVSEGTPLKLHTNERRMAMRRLADKMLKNTDSIYCTGKLTAFEVARRLQITDRSVIRYLAEMSPGEKRICPVCREDMWIVDGVVEEHPDRLFSECPMSGTQVRRGLAAIRPELYAWAEEVSA